MAAYLIGEIDMITCKEDLLKTYIVNDGEIRGLYIGLCNKFGIKCESNSNASGAVDVTNADYIEVYAGICFYTNTPSKESSRELTIDDLQEKPKPTKFVKVEESIFDLKEEFEKGELYEKGNGYTKLISESDFAFSYRENAVYRQVEIDWVESAIGLAPAGYGLKRSLSYRLAIEGSYDKEQALILANAIIESLTDKPE